MNEETLNQFFGEDGGGFQQGPATVKEVFTTVLPTGEGKLEQILDVLGLREHYEQALQWIDLSSTMTFYVFVALAILFVWLLLRLQWQRAIARKKRKLLNEGHHNHR